MRNGMLAAFYTALVLGANPTAAETAFEGDMKKLTLVEARALPEAVLLDAQDGEHALEGFRGQWVVLNFWATWCAPCRAEMPSLDRLQAALPQIAVVPVATGRNSVTGIEKFYAEAGVTRLPVLRDPGSDLSRSLGVLGLPVTLVVDPEGREVARLIGDAEWDSPQALAALAAIMSR